MSSRFIGRGMLVLSSCMVLACVSGGPESGEPVDGVGTPDLPLAREGSSTLGDDGRATSQAYVGLRSLDSTSACSVLAPTLMTTPPLDGPLPTFTRATLAEQPGAAFLHAQDLDNDGFPEFLLTTLLERTQLFRLPRTIVGSIIGKPAAPVSAGGAYVVRRKGGAPTDGTLGEWQVDKAFDRWAGIEWPNESELFDVDNDGTEDWVIGAGFLARPTGRLVWMKGERRPSGLQFGRPRQLDIPDRHYWYHVAKPLDMDGDGDTDFVTTNHKGAVGVDTSRLEWFENDGKPGRASFTYHLIAERTGGALLELFDVDRDGDQDILLPQFFHGESLIWMENASGNGESWVRHVIDDSTGRGFAVRVADVDGNGRPDLVYTNHNHQAATDPSDRTMGAYWWSIPEPSNLSALSNWGAFKHVIHEGFLALGGPEDANSIGAPGAFNVGDIDRDGDLDVSVSGDGDPGLHLFIQQEGGHFDATTLDTGHENSGGQIMADLDGDCDLDIIWAVFGPQKGLVPTSKIYAFLQQ